MKLDSSPGSLSLKSWFNHDLLSTHSSSALKRPKMQSVLQQGDKSLSTFYLFSFRHTRSYNSVMGAVRGKYKLWERDGKWGAHVFQA